MDGGDHPKSTAQVNQYLHSHGVPKDVKLVRGKGYFYFDGGDTSGWYTSSVYTYQVSDFNLEAWLGEYKDLESDQRNPNKRKSSIGESGMNKQMVASELVKVAKELIAANKEGRFFIEMYKDGKRKRSYFDTIQEATEVADKIFKLTGIMVGIEQE